jgi:hypothetical protein
MINMNASLMKAVPSGMLTATIQTSPGLINISNAAYPSIAMTSNVMDYPLLYNASGLIQPLIWVPLNSTGYSNVMNNGYTVTASSLYLRSTWSDSVYYTGTIYPLKGDAFEAIRSTSYISSSLTDIQTIQSSTGVTISLWAAIGIGQCTVSNRGALFSFFAGSDVLYIDKMTKGISLEFWNLYFVFYYDSKIQYTNSQPICDNKFHHYATTIAVDATLTFWVDGVQSRFFSSGFSGSTLPLVTVSSLSGTNTNYFGYSWKTGGTLNGAMQDIRIYPLALQVQDIQTIYWGRVDFFQYINMYAACPGSCSPSQTLHCLTNGTGVCCGGGQFFIEGTSNACQNCSVGTNSDGSGSTCLACAVGTFVQGQACLNCTAGTYGSSTGLSACTACSAGMYGTGIAMVNAGVCTNCSAGTYSAVAGADSASNCTGCPAGTYSGTAGLSSSGTDLLESDRPAHVCGLHGVRGGHVFGHGWRQLCGGVRGVSSEQPVSRGGRAVHGECWVLQHTLICSSSQ